MSDATRLAFAADGPVRRMGVRTQPSDLAREMFWPVIAVAYFTLVLIWVLRCEMTHPGYSHGAWPGLVAAWVIGNALVALRAIRLAQETRIIEVAPERVVLRAAGREHAWHRHQIAGVRSGYDYLALELTGPRRRPPAVLVTDLPGRELSQAAQWLREAMAEATAIAPAPRSP